MLGPRVIRETAFLLSTFLFIGLVGCGHTRTAVHTNWMDQPQPKIAVFPLVGDDVFSGPIFGEGVAEALINELVNDGYPVMERSHLRKIMEEHSLQYMGAFDPASLSQLGKLSGVDTIVMGSLTTREIVSAFEYLLGDGVPRVQIDTVRLKWVDVDTGQILASVILQNARGGSPEYIARKIVRGLDREIKMLSKSSPKKEYIAARTIKPRAVFALSSVK